MSEVAKLLSTLVAIDTVSSRSNVSFVEKIGARLAARGFRIETRGYAVDGVEKRNLIASAGPITTPSGRDGLALVGHTDTVPFDPTWSEALTLTERDGNLYARGSADTKGFIAAALTAVEALALDELVRPLVLVFTADEEIGCIGAKRLLDERALAPAHAIVGEPTELTPVRAHKGYWLAEVEVEGAEAHSAYPAVGRSAIFGAARLLARIEGIAEELQADEDAQFEPPFTSLNVGTITGGKARNVIPGACSFPLEWRPLPHQDGEKVAHLLAREVERLRAQDAEFRAKFELLRRDPAVETSASAPIVRFLEEQTGRPARTVPFGTELPYLNALGAQGCVIGPGDIRVAHRTGEFVPRAQLEAAVILLRGAIDKFCVGP